MLKWLWLLLLAGCADPNPHWECTKEEFDYFLPMLIGKQIYLQPHYRCVDSVWVVPPPQEQDDGHREADS